MAQRDRTYLKSRFETDDRPSEADFADFIDSFHHKTEDSFTIADNSITPAKMSNGTQGRMPYYDTGGAFSELAIANGLKIESGSLRITTQEATVDDMVDSEYNLGDVVSITDTGALFLISATGVSGYADDDLAVVNVETPSGSGFGILLNPSLKTFGVADSLPANATSNIQSMIDYVTARGLDVLDLQFDNGEYEISSLTIADFKTVRIKGEANTKLKLPDGSYDGAAFTPMISITNCDNVIMEDFTADARFEDAGVTWTVHPTQPTGRLIYVEVNQVRAYGTAVFNNVNIVNHPELGLYVTNTNLADDEASGYELIEINGMYAYKVAQCIGIRGAHKNCHMSNMDLTRLRHVHNLNSGIKCIGVSADVPVSPTAKRNPINVSVVNSRIVGGGDGASFFVSGDFQTVLMDNVTQYRAGYYINTSNEWEDYATTVGEEVGGKIRTVGGAVLVKLDPVTYRADRTARIVNCSTVGSLDKSTLFSPVIFTANGAVHTKVIGCDFDIMQMATVSVEEPISGGNGGSASGGTEFHHCTFWYESGGSNNATGDKFYECKWIRKGLYDDDGFKFDKSILTAFTGSGPQLTAGAELHACSFHDVGFKVLNQDKPKKVIVDNVTMYGHGWMEITRDASDPLDGELNLFVNRFFGRMSFTYRPNIGSITREDNSTDTGFFLEIINSCYSIVSAGGGSNYPRALASTPNFVEHNNTWLDITVTDSTAAGFKDFAYSIDRDKWTRYIGNNNVTIRDERTVVCNNQTVASIYFRIDAIMQNRHGRRITVWDQSGDLDTRTLTFEVESGENPFRLPDGSTTEVIDINSWQRVTVECNTQTNTWDVIEDNGPLTTVSKIKKYTASAASALTASDGLLIYVTSTDATFTSVGFWGYENGAWVKM